MMKVALHTLGCKLNYAETSTIGRQFLERGFDVVEAGQPADVFVLNTCSVTERADKECRQLVRRALRQTPHAYVIVLGCYAQLRPEEIARLEGVDLVLGTAEKFRVFDHAGDFSKSATPEVFVSCIDDAGECNPAFSTGEVGGRTRAFLKVQDGCDFHCSFCTIPLARGASRSRPLGLVLDDARRLAADGSREIVLTGVNVGDYGKKQGSSLIGLLRALGDVDGIDRIRISSIEPNLLTRPLVDLLLSSGGKFCNHFHIPLQSGSDPVLKLMRRRYTTRDYRSLIEYIRQQDPDAGIGVDVIAGSPGETDPLFRETCSFLAELPISYLHVFTYSGRPDTAAAAYGDHVEPRVRFERSEQLRILGARKRFAFYASFLGKTLPVLYESPPGQGRAGGLTPNYIRVEVPSAGSLVNEIRETKLESVVGGGGDLCLGRLLGRQSTPSGGISTTNLATVFNQLDVSQSAELP